MDGLSNGGITVKKLICRPQGARHGSRHASCRHPLIACAAAAVLTLTVLLAPSPTPAAGSGTLTASPSTIKAPDDFSSTYRGYWWDFASDQHYSPEGTRKGWLNPGLVDGWWIGTSTAVDSAVRFSQLRIDTPPTNWEPSEHRYTPLDPAYRYLSIRVCRSASSQTMVRWHTNLSFGDYDFGGTKWRFADKGCSVSTFDLVGEWNAQMKGPMRWGQAEPTFYAFEFLPVSNAGIEVRIDYATLSPSPTGAGVTIGWSASDEPVDLSFSSDPGGEHATPIAGNLSGGSYLWQTPNLAPGTYYVHGSGARGQRLSSAVLVVDAPPRGTLIAPSYTSGPDYATTVLRNPWDMSSAADIQLARKVSGASLANGIYSATSLPSTSRTGDPGIFLRVNPRSPINTRRFRYLTYRMWVDDQGLLASNGGVARIIWYEKNTLPPFVVTQDIKLYKGWRTVTVDLATAYREAMSRTGPWSSYNVSFLRLDPHESPVPRRFAIDWVKLTGDNVAGSSYRIRYLAEDAEGSPTARFFTGGSRNPRGSAPIICQPDPTPPPGAGRTCLWDTSTLPAGKYFVHMRLVDSAGNLSWVTSDLPLIRR